MKRFIVTSSRMAFDWGLFGGNHCRVCCLWGCCGLLMLMLYGFCGVICCCCVSVAGLVVVVKLVW